MSYFNFFRAHDQFMPQHFRFRSGGFMMPRGGNVSITENINIKNGPSGFWGFMTGLSQGLFGGGMGCGMGMGSIFGCPSMPMMGMGMPMIGSPYAMLNGTVTPQGATSQSSSGEDAHLKNLTEFYGKSFIIKSHPDKKGIYQAVPKDGGKPIEGTYDELMNKLAEDKETQTVDPSKKKESEKTEAQLKEEKAKEKGLELKDGKYFKGSVEYEWDSTIKDFKEKVPEKSEEDPLSSKDEKPVQSTRTRRSGGRSRTRGAESPERIDEGKKVSDKENKSAAYTASVKWTTVPIMNSFHIIKGYQCTAIVSFTDKNGDSHVYKHTDKFESYTETGREAKCKAQVIGHIQNSIKKEGWTNVTIK